MQHKDTIPFQHWSHKVGRIDPITGEVPEIFGVIVTAVDDLHQCISNLILTPLGSVPTAPEKGCDIEPYIDRHADIAIPNVTRAIWDALTMWEPRIVLQEVKVEQVGEAHFSCRIFWRPSESVLDDLRVTQVSIGTGPRHCPEGCMMAYHPDTVTLEELLAAPVPDFFTRDTVRIKSDLVERFEAEAGRKLFPA